ncbi:MAG: hypothetical protein R2932_30410 [Caldilineaceae bacterium]
MSDGQVTSKAQAATLDNSTSVGAEFEVEGGFGLKVQTGAGIERTTGVASEVVESTSWSNEINMSGQTFGFPVPTMATKTIGCSTAATSSSPTPMK